MEFSRFGGNITNGYWGCCACCILQDFNQNPDEKASIQLVDGDGATGIFGDKGQLYAGPTYRDIFWQRLRFGTFSIEDMPNHAFLAILTQGQLDYGHGKAWLAILKEAGFEFIRTINNSVYTGPYLAGSDDVDYDYDEDCDCHPVHGDSANYLFGLFRNIGRGCASNPFQPPKEWLELPKSGPEVYDFIEMFGEDISEFVSEQRAAQLAVWKKLPGTDTLLSEEELRAKDVPVWLSGRRVNDAKPKIKPKDAKSKETSLRGVADTTSPGIAKVVKKLPDEFLNVPAEVAPISKG